jgi:N-acetylmuramoyl-L-alanine amidase
MVGQEALGRKGTGPDVLIKKADACRDALYKSPNKMKYRHNWSSCTKLYGQVYTRYPKSGEAAWALYKSARMHTKLYGYSGSREDLDHAIEQYRKLMEAHPKHTLADDAQYRIGEIYYQEKGNPTQAYVEFLKVEIKYPSGDMRPKAKAMLDKLSVILSDKDSQRSAQKIPRSGGALTQVKNIRHWSTPTYTRVVIDLERPVKYTSNLLKEDPKNKKPRRLYVDLNNAYVSSDIESSIPIKDGLLQRARAGQYSKEKVRVVLDINDIRKHKIFHLHDPFRIVVDVRGTDKKAVRATPKSGVKKRPVRRGIRKAGTPDKSISLARQLGLNVKRIVIDPGHGGRDPGTSYRGSIKEKNIVLNLSKLLAVKIEEKLGCEVILTRQKDVFMALEKRTAFANVKKADLFISLHVNSHKQTGVRGIETYFLNMATDKRAVMLAAAENATSEKNISDLQMILNELMLNTKINESSRLAHEVQKGIIRKAQKKNRWVKDLGVKQAPFYVLIGAEMPAILIEVGFITNPTERKRLQSRAYLNSLADGVVAGIDNYRKSIEVSYKGG